ncbi:MAG: hypothetical protein ACJ8J7_17475 [Sulfurifustaceae bacterium]
MQRMLGTLVGTLIALVLASAASGAAAAIGSEQSLWKPTADRQTADKSGASGVAARDNTEAPAREDEHWRQASEKACQQAVSTAAQIGEQLRVLGATVLPAMTQMGEEFAREMEPTMREIEPKLRRLEEHLREMARQMDESLSQKRSSEGPTPQR